MPKQKFSYSDELGTVDGLEWGDCKRAKRSALLVHSSGAGASQWSSLARNLQEADSHCIAPNLIGYGETQVSSSAAYSLIDEVHVLELATNGVPRKLHVVAHSFGAVVAMAFAHKFPERVASLTVYEPVLFGLLKDYDRLIEWTSIQSVANQQRYFVNAGHNKWAAAIFMGYWLGRFKWLLSPASFKQHVSNVMPKVSDEFSLMWKEAWRPVQGDSPFPLHIIYGMNTTSEMGAVMNILVDRSPSAHLSVIKGATHLLPILKPQKFNEVATTWLRKIW